MNAQGAAKRHIFGALQALGNHGGTQALGHRHQRFQQHRAHPTAPRFVHQPPVDLDVVRAHHAQHRQAVKSCPHIVQRNTQPLTAQVITALRQPGRVDFFTLHHFNHHLLVANAPVTQPLHKLRGPVGLHERGRQHVQEQGHARL